MSIKSRHDFILNKFQTLLPKTCIIKFPNTDAVMNINLRGKTFKIPQVSSSGVEIERLKPNNETYSASSSKLTILYSILEEVKDTTDTINIPINNFKENNVVVIFNGKKYTVEDEKENPFESSISLYCDRNV